MAREGTKQALLLTLLARKDGITIREIAEETGWKVNTVHSALTTLRKLGRSITIDQGSGARRYRLAAAD